VVVLERAIKQDAPRITMSKQSDSEKLLRGINWDAIFLKRPDLSPPGYKETVQAMYPDKNPVQDKDLR
jgi:hypothetical protein